MQDPQCSVHARLQAYDTGAFLYHDSTAAKASCLKIATILDSILKSGESDATITIRPYSCHDYGSDEDLRQYTIQQRRFGTAIVYINNATVNKEDQIGDVLYPRQYGQSYAGSTEVTYGNIQDGHLILSQDVHKSVKK